MEQRRRRRTSDPTEAAECLATGLREVAEFAAEVGVSNPNRMHNHLERLRNQLGVMSAIARDYQAVIEDHNTWHEPLEFDVWGEDEQARQSAVEPA